MVLARAALNSYQELYGTPEAALAYALRDARAALARYRAEPPCGTAGSDALDDRTIGEALATLRLFPD